MPASEYEEWRQSYVINPFGIERDNIHAAMLMSMYANSKSKKRFSVDEFMIKPKPYKTKEQKAQEFMNALMSIEKVNGDK